MSSDGYNRGYYGQNQGHSDPSEYQRGQRSREYDEAWNRHYQEMGRFAREQSDFARRSSPARPSAPARSEALALDAFGLVGVAFVATNVTGDAPGWLAALDRVLKQAFLRHVSDSPELLLGATVLFHVVVAALLARLLAAVLLRNALVFAIFSLVASAAWALLAGTLASAVGMPQDWQGIVLIAIALLFLFGHWRYWRENR